MLDLAVMLIIHILLSSLWGSVFALNSACAGDVYSKHVNRPHSSYCPPNEQKTSFENFLSLQEGNRRFAAGKMRFSSQKKQSHHAHHHNPKVVILSCSDARVPPELVFDQDLGEIFSIRVAGQILGSGAIASMEYAVSSLGVNLIIVMGHESCGAIKTTLGAHAEDSTGSVYLDRLVSKIRPNIQSFMGKPINDPTFREPVKANVSAVVAQILSQSPLIQDAVREKKVLMAQGIYSIANLKVDFWPVDPKVLPKPVASPTQKN